MSEPHGFIHIRTPSLCQVCTTVPRPSGEPSAAGCARGSPRGARPPPPDPQCGGLVGPGGTVPLGSQRLSYWTRRSWIPIFGPPDPPPPHGGGTSESGWVGASTPPPGLGGLKRSLLGLVWKLFETRLQKPHSSSLANFPQISPLCPQ